MIKISIIVPVYNSAKYLKCCIDSLINQTLEHIEIIILNDGSSDDSDKIIQNYNDNRIKYVSKNNEGIAITRNSGINMVKGEYLTFVDSDDYLDKTFCEKMYIKAKEDNCDIVVCDYYNCENNELTKRSLENFQTTNLKDTPIIINNINLGPCNKIYLTRFIKSNKISFPERIKYEDAPFVCECLAKAQSIGKVNKALSYFTIHEGSQTTTRDKKIFDIFIVCELINESLKNILPSTIKEIFIINLIVNYLLQSKFITEKQIRNDFIEKCYLELEKISSTWHKKVQFNSKTFYKKIIIKNKFFLKIYCKLFINSII